MRERALEGTADGCSSARPCQLHPWCSEKTKHHNPQPKAQPQGRCVPHVPVLIPLPAPVFPTRSGHSHPGSYGRAAGAAASRRRSSGPSLSAGLSHGHPSAHQPCRVIGVPASLGNGAHTPCLLPPSSMGTHSWWYRAAARAVPATGHLRARPRPHLRAAKPWGQRHPGTPTHCSAALTGLPTQRWHCHNQGWPTGIWPCYYIWVRKGLKNDLEQNSTVGRVLQCGMCLSTHTLPQDSKPEPDAFLAGLFPSPPGELAAVNY